MSRGNGLHKTQVGMQKEMLLDQWERLCKKARELGRTDLIAKYQFPDNAGLSAIDKSTTPFARELMALGVTTW